MNPAFKFNKMFGLHLSDRMDGTLYSLLIVNVFLFSLIILGVTRIDYESIEAQWSRTVQKRYKEFIAELVMDQQKDTPEHFSSLQLLEQKRMARINKESRRKAAEKKIEQSVARRFQTAAAPPAEDIDQYSYLPDADEYVAEVEMAEPPQLSYKTTTWPASESRRAVGVNNFDAGDIHNPLKRPFNYVVNRKGQVFINVTDELVNEPQLRNGYRNPEEIERVVAAHQPMIEHCFKKASYMAPGLKGYVKVSFSISPEGFVLPESIRIIDSTIRSKQFESCIKEYIKRWRSFEKLDESMGIARVVQKFIFN